MSQKNNRIDHFSLIELLVVLAVFAVLLSLLQYSLNSIMERGRFTICNKNLHEQGLALTEFLEDYNEFPYSQRWVEGHYYFDLKDSLHKGKTAPYLKNEDSYICPTYRIVNDVTPGRLPVKSFSYSMNSNIDDLKYPYKISYPSLMGMIAEENPFKIGNSYGNPHSDFKLVLGAGKSIGFFVDGLGTFHLTLDNNYYLGVSNVLYVDGHTEKGRLEDAYSIMTASPK